MADRHSVFDDERTARREEDADWWRARGRALWRWMAARPMESWLFFVGGVLVGRVLF